VEYGEVAGPREVGGTPRAWNVPDTERSLAQHTAAKCSEQIEVNGIMDRGIVG